MSTDPEVINFFSLIDTAHINLAVEIGLERYILILIRIALLLQSRM